MQRLPARARRCGLPPADHRGPAGRRTNQVPLHAVRGEALDTPTSRMRAAALSGASPQPAAVFVRSALRRGPPLWFGVDCDPLPLSPGASVIRQTIPRLLSRDPSQGIVAAALFCLLLAMRPEISTEANIRVATKLRYTLY